MNGANHTSTSRGKGIIPASLRRLGGRLWRDRAGNTLAVAAVSLLLLLTAVGGGVDMSRAYMTKTNLQAACDSGVLAGRRALSKAGTYGDAEKAKAAKMFNFNMHAAQTSSKNVSFETESHDDGSVTGTASATMPMAIMDIFGGKDIKLDVACSAELQMASADVMFVLDVTGSMAGTKIQGLRDAVRDFHKTVAEAVINKDETVIRYAFVPYSQTVNASGIVASGAMQADWFADHTLYQTKVAVFDTLTYRLASSTPVNTEESTTSFSKKSDCQSWGDDQGSTTTGTPPAQTVTTTYAYKRWTSKSSTCKRTKTVTTKTYNQTPVYGFTKWRWKPATMETIGLVSNGSLSLIRSLSSTDYVATAGSYDMRALAKLQGSANTSLPTPTAYSWNGCIEERQTVVNYAMDPVPDGALDLNINDAPTAGQDNTKWKAYWASAVYSRGSDAESDSGSGNPTERCPAPMRQFEAVDTHDPNVTPDWLDTYLDNLVAVGSTYHDIGMIWGARLASTRGMFSENVLDGDRNSVSRHILFMTDGVMEPGSSAYNAYGIEDLDHRIAPDGAGSGANSTLANYHTKRFLAACQKAKEEGYTVWVVSFGTAITTAMKTCSSGERAYFASDSTELKSAFRYIAGQVADLRINK